MKTLGIQIFLTLLLGTGLYFLLRPSTIYFIDNTKVVTHYVRHKGYDKDLTNKALQMQKDIDSVSTYLNSIQGMSSGIDTLKAAREMAAVTQMKDQFESYLKAEDQRLSARVTEELSIQVKKYCEANKISILFGANGNANILYSADGMDITDSFIQYLEENAK